MIEEHIFESKAVLYEALHAAIATDVAETLAFNEKALLLASGGSSPAPVYRALSLQALPWQRINVALVDERWVDLHESGSNEALLADSLKQNQALNVDLYGMKNQAPTASEGWSECEARYQALPWQGAVALLGMGPDGHTASLFPDSAGLNHALATDDLVAPINAIQSDVTGALTERMSLSLSALARCKKLYLLITGTEKKQVYERAKEDAQIPGAHPLVISHLLARSDINLQVFWAP